MALAHALHGADVPSHKGDAPRRGADDGLGEEGGDLVGPEGADLGVELVRQALHVGRVALPAALVAVRVAGGDGVEACREERLVELAARHVASERERWGQR